MSTSECWTERIGWFGKIPAAGDFVGRGLPANFVRSWDEWLSAGLCEARHLLSEHWTEAYRQAPVLCLLLGPGVLTESAWRGILLPSMDRLGREFPLIVAQCSAPALVEASGHQGVEAPKQEWWDSLVRVAQQSLEHARSADAMEELLAMFVRGRAADLLTDAPDCEPPAARILAESGQSAWWRFEAGRLPTEATTIFQGLPPGPELRRLLGFG
ncbi:MAG TPA: type VI secretion system-associated protein TagF [Steroidobacteraceae bacterium]|nr:type VI secretion system-associated protein TagF [Steroidobacteraceae bacterium]